MNEHNNEYKELILMKILNKKLYKNETITKEMFEAMEIEIEHGLRRINSNIDMSNAG